MTELQMIRDFSFNLNSMLNKYRMSQKELCEETGIDTSTMSGYINAKRMPSLKNILNIAHVLGCDISELIDNDELIV